MVRSHAEEAGTGPFRLEGLALAGFVSRTFKDSSLNLDIFVLKAGMGATWQIGVVMSHARYV